MDENIIINKLFRLANKAYNKGEIPVSALLIRNNKIVAQAYNQKEKKYDITAHAEILTIKKSAKKLRRWNLSDCDLYVTLKPCSMCMEIIKQSRIRNVFYLLDKLDYKHDFTKTKLQKINYDLDKENYQQLLSKFFQNMR